MSSIRAVENVLVVMLHVDIGINLNTMIRILNIHIKFKSPVSGVFFSAVFLWYPAVRPAVRAPTARWGPCRKAGGQGPKHKIGNANSGRDHAQGTWLNNICLLD